MNRLKFACIDGVFVKGLTWNLFTGGTEIITIAQLSDPVKRLDAEARAVNSSEVMLT